MKKKRGLIRSAAAALAAVGLLGAFFAGATDEAASKKSTRVSLPVVNITQGEQCVEPTEEMRKNHMQKILHQRDKTMHEGIRTTQHSLKNCVDCHADPKTNSVLGENGFCASCHSYAAVSMDCFTCHTDKRDTKTNVKTGAAGRQPHGEHLAQAAAAFSHGNGAANQTTGNSQ